MRTASDGARDDRRFRRTRARLAARRRADHQGRREQPDPRSAFATLLAVPGKARPEPAASEPTVEARPPRDARAGEAAREETAREQSSSAPEIAQDAPSDPCDEPVHADGGAPAPSCTESPASPARHQIRLTCPRSSAAPAHAGGPIHDLAALETLLEHASLHARSSGSELVMTVRRGSRGLRIGVLAYGGRRVGLRVRSNEDVSESELAELVRALRARSIEVVDVD